MKIIVYTLNNDGTIPNYVIDGGYFPCENGGKSPMNLDLVGIATDDAIQNQFNSKQDLLNYVENKTVQQINPITSNPIPFELMVDYIWSKLN
jgi:hypothetical protein